MKDAPAAVTTTAVPLPHPTAEPLSHLPSWLPDVLWLAAFAATILLWAGWKWRKARRKKHSQPGRPAAEPVPFAGRPAGTVESIRAIRRDGLRTGHTREGCHALSQVLRAHLEATSGRKATSLTASGLLSVFGAGTPADCFIELELLQYGRNEPSTADFAGLCDRAESLAARKR